MRRDNGDGRMHVVRDTHVDIRVQHKEGDALLNPVTSY